MSDRCTDAPKCPCDIWGTYGCMGGHTDVWVMYRHMGACADVQGNVQMYQGCTDAPLSDRHTNMPDNPHMPAN